MQSHPYSKHGLLKCKNQQWGFDYTIFFQRWDTQLEVRRRASKNVGKTLPAATKDL